MAKVISGHTLTTNSTEKYKFKVFPMGTDSKTKSVLASTPSENDSIEDTQDKDFYKFLEESSSNASQVLKELIRVL